MVEKWRKENVQERWQFFALITFNQGCKMKKTGRESFVLAFGQGKLKTETWKIANVQFTMFEDWIVRLMFFVVEKSHKILECILKFSTFLHDLFSPRGMSLIFWQFVLSLLENSDFQRDRPFNFHSFLWQNFWKFLSLLSSKFCTNPPPLLTPTFFVFL